MFTYFIQRTDGGPIKIGKTVDIGRRLFSLQGGLTETLVCIAYIDGDWEEELHDKFDAMRVCGEWFTPDRELLDFIRKHATATDIRRPPLTPEQVAKKRAGRRQLAEDNAKYTGRFKRRVPWEAA